MSGYRKKIKEGDVFLIPLDQGFVFGHVLEVGLGGLEFYMCVYDYVAQYQDDVKSALGSELLFMGLTDPSWIRKGEWTYVNNFPVNFSYPRPNNVVNTPNGMILRTFDDEYIRNAVSDDLSFYGYKKSVHPISFVNAARAKFGFERAEKDYTHLLISDANRRSML